MMAEPGWGLAEAFDRSAREPDADPDPSVMAALTEHGSLEILDALFDAFEEVCHLESATVARHYASHLETLAAALDDPVRRAVLAVVDLRLGWMSAGDDWSEARDLAERAAPDLAELVPDLMPDLHALRAGVAEADSRPADARVHWELARDGYVATEQWGEAAHAAEAMAALAPQLSHAVLAEWRQAAGWHVLSGAEDAAAECAEQAIAALTRSWPQFAEGAEQQARELAEQAAEFALEHGHALLAAHVRSLTCSLAAALDEPWPAVCATCDEARAAYTGIELADGERRLAMARIDYFQGLAAVANGREPDAEALLSRALPALRESGTDEEVQTAESQLAAIIVRTEGPAATLHPTARWTTAEARAGALFVEGLRQCGRGAVDAGIPMLDEAARLHAAAGNPDTAAAIDGFIGAMRALSGDRGAGEAALKRLEDHQQARAERSSRPGRVLLTAARGVLRWVLAQLTGDRDRWLAELVRTEHELMELGVWMPAANLAMVRGHDLAEAGRASEALAVTLPAVLALDAHRSGLPDAGRRSRWAARVAAGFDTAVRAAAACGETLVLAELLEVARGNAIPTPRASVDRDDAISALGAAFFPEPATPFATGERPGAASLAGGAERTMLGLPALIRTPWASIALVAELDRATRYRDPIRAKAVAKWIVAERRP